jgi:hypothetical protein
MTVAAMEIIEMPGKCFASVFVLITVLIYRQTNIAATVIKLSEISHFFRGSSSLEALGSRHGKQERDRT